MARKIKIKTFLRTQQVAVDVYDDRGNLGVCYEPGITLTKPGKEYFKEVLELKIEVFKTTAYVEEYPDDIHLENKLHELFWGMAGYISQSRFKLYFKESE